MGKFTDSQGLKGILAHVHHATAFMLIMAAHISVSFSYSQFEDQFHH